MKNRKIVQLCTGTHGDDSITDYTLLALCNDGTIWYYIDYTRTWVYSPEYSDIPQTDLTTPLIKENRMNDEMNVIDVIKTQATEALDRIAAFVDSVQERVNTGAESLEVLIEQLKISINGEKEVLETRVRAMKECDTPKLCTDAGSCQNAA